MLRGILSALRGRAQSPSPSELLKEKRLTPRRATEQQLIVKNGGQTFPGRCLDQSTGGVRFECSAQEVVRKGDTVELTSTGTALRLNGKVVWVSKMPNGRRQIGVKREGALEPNARERREYVRVRAPLMASHGRRQFRVLDVSLKGLRVQGEERVNGPEITLDLHLPGPPMPLLANVLEAGRVARLSFASLDEASQQRLGQFLAGVLRPGA